MKEDPQSETGREYSGWRTYKEGKWQGKNNKLWCVEVK